MFTTAGLATSAASATKFRRSIMVWSRVDNVLLVASIPPPPLLPYASSSSYPNGNVEGADDDDEEDAEDEEDEEGSFFLGAVLHPKTSLDVVAAADGTNI